MYATDVILNGELLFTSKHNEPPYHGVRSLADNLRIDRIDMK